MSRSRHAESSPAESRPPDMGGGYTALAYLITGVGLYGGLGWLLDTWLGTAFLLPVGIVAGAGLGILLVIRRYGREFSGSGKATTPPPPEQDQEHEPPPADRR